MPALSIAALLVREPTELSVVIHIGRSEGVPTIVRGRNPNGLCVVITNVNVSAVHHHDVFIRSGVRGIGDHRWLGRGGAEVGGLCHLNQALLFCSHEAYTVRPPRINFDLYINLSRAWIRNDARVGPGGMDDRPLAIHSG